MLMQIKIIKKQKNHSWLRTHSISMKVDDYLRIENPKLGNFVEDITQEEYLMIMQLNIEML